MTHITFESKTRYHLPSQPSTANPTKQINCWITPRILDRISTYVNILAFILANFAGIGE